MSLKKPNKKWDLENRLEGLQEEKLKYDGWAMGEEGTQGKEANENDVIRQQNELVKEAVEQWRKKCEEEGKSVEESPKLGCRAHHKKNGGKACEGGCHGLGYIVKAKELKMRKDVEREAVVKYVAAVVHCPRFPVNVFMWLKWLEINIEGMESVMVSVREELIDVMKNGEDEEEEKNEKNVETEDEDEKEEEGGERMVVNGEEIKGGDDRVEGELEAQGQWLYPEQMWIGHHREAVEMAKEMKMVREAMEEKSKEMSELQESVIQMADQNGKLQEQLVRVMSVVEAMEKRGGEGKKKEKEEKEGGGSVEKGKGKKKKKRVVRRKRKGKGKKKQRKESDESESESDSESESESDSGSESESDSGSESESDREGEDGESSEESSSSDESDTDDESDVERVRKREGTVLKVLRKDAEKEREKQDMKKGKYGKLEKGTTGFKKLDKALKSNKMMTMNYQLKKRTKGVTRVGINKVRNDVRTRAEEAPLMMAVGSVFAWFELRVRELEKRKKKGSKKAKKKAKDELKFMNEKLAKEALGDLYFAYLPTLLKVDVKREAAKKLVVGEPKGNERVEPIVKVMKKEEEYAVVQPESYVSVASRGVTSPGPLRRPVSQPVRAPNSPLTCYRCAEVGHLSYNCPNPVVCNQCHGKGHYARDCRSRVMGFRQPAYQMNQHQHQSQSYQQQQQYQRQPYQGSQGYHNQTQGQGPPRGLAGNRGPPMGRGRGGQ